MIERSDRVQTFVWPGSHMITVMTQSQQRSFVVIWKPSLRCVITMVHLTKLYDVYISAKVRFKTDCERQKGKEVQGVWKLATSCLFPLS